MFSTKSAIFTLALLFLPSAHGLEIYHSPEGSFNYVMASGVLVEEDIRKLGQPLYDSAVLGVPSVILLTSQGGALEITPEIAKQIVTASDLLFKHHGQSNLLIINEECSSACAVLTAHLTKHRDPRALDIWVTPSAVFGFHSPVEKRGKRYVSIADPIEREIRIKKQLTYLADSGVDPQWLRNNEEMFRKPEFTEVKAVALCKSLSLVIPPRSCLATDDDVIPLVEQRYPKKGDFRPPRAAKPAQTKKPVARSKPKQPMEPRQKPMKPTPSSMLPGIFSIFGG